MTIRYRCGIECYDGGKIHTLRSVSNRKSYDFKCLDCGMNVTTGDRELGEQVGEEVL